MPMYVPRDEAFGDVKRQTVDAGSWKGMVNNIFPFLKDQSTEGETVKSFSEINELYKGSPSNESQRGKKSGKTNNDFPIKLNKMIKDSTSDAFKFDPPNIVSSKKQNSFSPIQKYLLYMEKIITRYSISGDASCCLRDDEFGRLTLAGMNPISIERLKVYIISSSFFVD